MDDDRSRARLQRAVGGSYRVGALIGRGGFAEVFEADDTRLARKVAIKALRPDVTVSKGLLERFQREARAMAGLRHPNVMDVYTVGEVDGIAYFVMPLIEGEALAQRIEREGPIAIEEARRILLEASSALGAAHAAGTIHRDVKPDNILLEGEEGRVLIADFGIAKALEEETSVLTGSGVFVGTPRYMSPEQATGDPLDHRSDIYSLGVVAFEMIAGRPPFEARTVQALMAKHLTEAPPPLWSVRSECPERLAHVVDRCLAKDPGERWNTLADMVAALEGGRELPVSLGPKRPSDARATEGHGRGEVPARALSAFRRTAIGVGAAAAALVALDVALGLGGVSAWLAVVALVYLTSRAGRLWRAGYEWSELLRPPESGETGPDHRDAEDFGRFGSLVRSSTAERATILKAFAQLPRQEQARFPDLRALVESVIGRIKHLARKVATLERRIAETAEASERERRSGPGLDAELATSSLSRYAARMQEIKGARDEAAADMRLCVSRLVDVREALTVRARLDASRAMDGLARTLSEVDEYLSQRTP